MDQYGGGIPAPQHCELKGTLIDQQSVLHVCSQCGWWLAIDRAVLPAVRWQLWSVTLVSSAVLKELDLSDINIPIEEVRRYLTRKFEMRHLIHPRVFEETVASVFRDHGYSAEVTAYTNDGGVDVILMGDSNEAIGVQVKRRKRAIEVEQIRSFLGALTLGKYTRGIFVSTSPFQSGAKDAANTCSSQHIPIELVDAKRFLEMLQVAQILEGPGPDDCGISRDIPPQWVSYSEVHLNSL